MFLAPANSTYVEIVMMKGIYTHVDKSLKLTDMQHILFRLCQMNPARLLTSKADRCFWDVWAPVPVYSVLFLRLVPSYAYSNALKSSGTLLPLPALYLLGPPLNCLGMGSDSSGWNLNLASWTVNLGPPPPLPIWLVPRERAGEPPFDRVYAEASMGCNAPVPDPRDCPPAVGIEVMDLAALGGGGGGGGAM
jgi:hypothetical protein